MASIPEDTSKRDPSLSGCPPKAATTRASLGVSAADLFAERVPANGDRPSTSEGAR